MLICELSAFQNLVRDRQIDHQNHLNATDALENQNLMEVSPDLMAECPGAMAECPGATVGCRDAMVVYPYGVDLRNPHCRNH